MGGRPRGGQDLHLALSPALCSALGTPADPPPPSLLPVYPMPRAPRLRKGPPRQLSPSCRKKKRVQGALLELGGGAWLDRVVFPTGYHSLPCSVRCLSLCSFDGDGISLCRYFRKNLALLRVMTCQAFIPSTAVSLSTMGRAA